MFIKKVYILFIFCMVIGAEAKNKTAKIKYSGGSATRVVQTYRFDALPDNGSYTIKIDSISSNVNIVTHEGSGAKIIIKSIASGISEEKANYRSDFGKKRREKSSEIRVKFENLEKMSKWTRLFQ